MTFSYVKIFSAILNSACSAVYNSIELYNIYVFVILPISFAGHIFKVCHLSFLVIVSKL